MFALIFSPFIVPFIFVRFGLRKTFSNDYISYGIAIGLSFIIGALLYYVKGLYIRSRANFRKTSSLYFVVLLVLTCGLPTFLGFYGISRSVWDSQLEVYWQYLIILVVTLLVGVVSYLFYEPNKGTSLWIYNWAFNLGFNRSFFEH
ncbi:MAG: hypothetical protein CMP67_02375 [Flavobacteriales bacterium]|nr:hypothetical protein [Flavobacteriales bacterium]